MEAQQCKCLQRSWRPADSKNLHEALTLGIWFSNYQAWLYQRWSQSFLETALKLELLLCLCSAKNEYWYKLWPFLFSTSAFLAQQNVLLLTLPYVKKHNPFVVQGPGLCSALLHLTVVNRSSSKLSMLLECFDLKDYYVCY